MRKNITRYDMPLPVGRDPQVAFLRAIDDAFAEPGPFTVERSDEMLILTTKNGTQLRAFVREILYEVK